jgi:diguanylate cyclase (GGDEF)-like protein
MSPRGDVLTRLNSTKKVLETEQSVFSRVGCEEFTIILLESDFKQSLTIANQIKKTISETPINLGTIKIYANISMGISNFDKNAFNNFSQMIRATEIKLSLAQDSGGNIINY